MGVRIRIFYHGDSVLGVEKTLNGLEIMLCKTAVIFVYKWSKTVLKTTFNYDEISFCIIMFLFSSTSTSQFSWCQSVSNINSTYLVTSRATSRNEHPRIPIAVSTRKWNRGNYPPTNTLSNLNSCQTHSLDNQISPIGHAVPSRSYCKKSTWFGCPSKVGNSNPQQSYVGVISFKNALTKDA